MKNKSMMLPMLAGFFVMGFGDIIGTVMNQVKAECAADATRIALYGFAVDGNTIYGLSREESPIVYVLDLDSGEFK